MTSDQGFWGDAGERSAALEALVWAWERGDPALPLLIERVDREVVALLERHRLPRGPITGIGIDDRHVPWAGRKLATCEMIFSGPTLAGRIRATETDSVIRTWVHESIHARASFAVGYTAEYRSFPGYEEGATERLTRIVLRNIPDLSNTNWPLSYYVMAWEVLAEQLEVSADRLFRSAWRAAPGDVRSSFPEILNTTSHEGGEDLLTGRQQARIRSAADRIFGADRLRYTGGVDEVRATWKQALQ